MKYSVEIADQLVPVDVRPLGPGRYQVKIGDGPIQVIDAESHGSLVHLVSERASSSVFLAEAKTGLHAHTSGTRGELNIMDSRSARRRAREKASSIGGGNAIVCSPMPGRVVSVLVVPDQEVKVGQSIAIVEAMKMENELHAEVDGTVSQIHVKAGDLVDGQAKLVTLTPN